MLTVRRTLVPFLSLALFASMPAPVRGAGAPGVDEASQQHVVPPQQLASTVGSHVADQDADRAAIHQALDRDDVQNIAASMHLDLSRARATVDTMAGADLAQAAAAARQINDTDLAGGASTVVISTTTIIIALLVLILLVVALK